MTEWSRVRKIVEAALDLEPAARRDYVQRTCEGDEALAEQVERMLARDEESTVAFDREISTELLDSDAQTVAAGTQIGSYRIVGMLGAGGMSTVFEAEQDQPRRTVALKTMRAGLLSSEARRRFEYESEILAQLRHPGIAQVYEVGSWNEPLAGQEVPFFAMEYVAGARPIDRFVSEELGRKEQPGGEEQPGRRALDLFLEVCDAVEYGHRFGVIHRDLKPANILVDREGRPKVIDFGIARATDPAGAGMTMLTGSGELLGTLRYMAPEQLDGLAQAIDTRVDVYALGVLLYQLLAGAAPFEPATMSIPAFSRYVREHEPTPPSQVEGSISAGIRELDWIVRRAMAADRDERYPSVAEFAADVKRYLAVEPVVAGPPSRTYKLRKFVRRNRVLVAGSALLLLTLVGGIFGTTWQMFDAQDARDEANRKAARAENVAKVFEIFLGFADPYERRIEMSGSEPTMREAVIGLKKLLDEGRLTELTKEADVEATVRYTLGHTYRQFGMFEEAEQLLRRALELRTQALGASHIDNTQILSMLAAVGARLGRQEEALKIEERVLAIRKQHYGAIHHEVAISLSNLAVSYGARRRYDDALRLLDEALQIYEKLDGDYERFVALALNLKGWTLHAAGRSDLAIATYLESLESFERANKSFHPRCAATHHGVAVIYQNQNELAKAAPHYRKAIEINTKVQGPGHINTIRSWLSLGSVLRQGELPQAEKELLAGLDAAKRGIGATHDLTRAFLRHLVILYRTQGRTEDRRQCAEQLRRLDAAAKDAAAKAKQQQGKSQTDKGRR